MMHHRSTTYKLFHKRHKYEKHYHFHLDTIPSRGNDNKIPKVRSEPEDNKEPNRDYINVSSLAGLSDAKTTIPHKIISEELPIPVWELKPSSQDSFVTTFFPIPIKYLCKVLNLNVYFYTRNQSNQQPKMSQIFGITPRNNNNEDEVASGYVHFRVALNLVKKGQVLTKKSSVVFESEDIYVESRKDPTYYHTILNLDFPKRGCPKPHDFAFFVVTRYKPKGQEFNDNICITNMVFEL